MNPSALPASIYHVADERSFPSIRANGLLPTTSIVRRWEVPPERAAQLLGEVRREPVELVHRELGRAWLRDQRQMTAPTLEVAMDGTMSSQEWCRRLNSLVFFFMSRESADGLLDFYRKNSQVLLELRTSSILRVYGSDVRLAHINTGYTMRRPAKRGIGTFTTIAGFNRGRSDVKEFAIRTNIEDLDHHLVGAWRYLPDRPPERLLP